MGLAHLQESQKSLLPLSALYHVRMQGEVGYQQHRRWLSPEPDHAGSLISDFQPPELQEINFCCL